MAGLLLAPTKRATKSRHNATEAELTAKLRSIYQVSRKMMVDIGESLESPVRQFEGITRSPEHLREELIAARTVLDYLVNHLENQSTIGVVRENERD